MKARGPDAASARHGKAGRAGPSTAPRQRTPAEPGEAESGARLRAIVDNAVDGIITIDEMGAITDVNPAALGMFGYEAREVLGRNVKILMPPPYHDEHDGYLRNYRRTGQAKIIGIGREVAGRRKDGTVFPVELSVSEVRLDDRRLFTGIVRDVTERKRVEDERQQFVSLVENSSDSIATANRDWRILHINRAGRELIGLAPDEVAGKEVRDLWHEETLPVVLAEALPAQGRGESFRFQGQVRHSRTGEPIDVDCNAFSILDARTGEITAFAFSLRDIREQKHAEQALRDSEARLKAILDSAVDGIVTINERGAIESVNLAAQTLFGYSSEELEGRNVKVLMPSPYHEEHDQYLRNYRHTGQRKIIGIGREVVGRKKDGTQFPVDLSVSEVELGDRRLFTGIMRDITGRKAAERSQDLLVAELSHRVKNTLAVVMSIVDRTFEQNVSYEDARASLAGRIRALAGTHSRLADSNWEGAPLRAVIEDEVSAYGHPRGGASQADIIRLQGPDVSLPPQTALAVGMALHELVTNAAKHGALSVTGGAIDVAWDTRRGGDKAELVIRWHETGVPGLKPPTRSGFGRMLLERGLAFSTGGRVELDFAEGGLQCMIICPL